MIQDIKFSLFSHAKSDKKINSRAGDLQNFQRINSLIFSTDTTGLFSIIKSVKFVMHTCFVSITSLRSFSVIGMINSLLKRLEDDEEKGAFVNLDCLLNKLCYSFLMKCRSSNCTILRFYLHDFFIVSVDYYLTILGIIQFCGIIFSFIPGFLLDWTPPGRHRNFSITLSFILTGLISILLTVGLSIPVIELQVMYR